MAFGYFQKWKGAEINDPARKHTIKQTSLLGKQVAMLLSHCTYTVQASTWARNAQSYITLQCYKENAKPNREVSTSFSIKIQVNNCLPGIYEATRLTHQDLNSHLFP